MRASFVSVILLGSVGCAAAPAAPAAQFPAGTSASAVTTAATAPPAHPTPRDALLVLAKRDHTLAIVDPVTLGVLAKVPVGEDPHEVVATADGHFAYVTNYGGGAFNTLAVVDLDAQSALPAIDLGPLRGPHGIVAKGGKIWFTAEAAKVVGSFDPASHKVDWVLGTGQNRTHMLFVTDDLKRVVTTNVSSATVSILEKSAGGPHSPPPPPPGRPDEHARPGPPDHGPHGPPGGDWDETVIPVGHGSEGFDVSPDGKEAWVANAQDGTVSIVDLATKSVRQTLNADVPSANRLKFTLDGGRALVSSLRGGTVAVIDVATRQVIKRIPVGHGSAGIQMQPGGKRAFVACSPDNDVAVIDLQTLTVVGHIDVGQEPDGMAWAVRTQAQ